MRTIKLFSIPENKSKLIKAIRIVFDREWDEYRVQFVKRSNNNVNEAMTYYCDDKQDALDTAQYEFLKHIGAA